MFEEYIPRKLIKERKFVEKVHSNIFDSSDEYEPVIKKLIYRLVNLDKNKLDKEIVCLTKREGLYIADYIPRNSYNVDMSNLLYIFYKIANTDNCKLMFRTWQDHYNKNECNEFFKQLLEGNQAMIEVVGKSKGLENDFKQALNSKSLQYVLGKRCYSNNRIATNKSIEERLDCYGIIKNTRLYDDIMYLLYTFCTKEDYLKADISSLTKLIKSYFRNKYLHKFLANFLTVLTIGELIRNITRFSPLIETLIEVIGEKDSKAYNNFFYRFDKELKKKYDTWMMSYTIRQALKDDARWEFWLQYGFEHVRLYRNSSCLLMQNRNYIIIEFSNDAKGPIYIYDKETYEKHFSTYIKMESNANVRSYLYNRSYQARLRKVHIGNWQWDMQWYLRQHKIAEEII